MTTAPVDNARHFQWGDSCPVHTPHHRCGRCAAGPDHRTAHRCACGERVMDEQQALRIARKVRRNSTMLLGVGVWAAASVDPLLGVIVGAYAAYVVTRPLRRFRPIFLPELLQQVARMRERGEWW